MKSRWGAPPLERFLDRVEITDSCWLWTGRKVTSNYGAFYLDVDNRSVTAHRWIYEQLVGPIPADLTIDHLCRVTNCVNPDHLEPVTHAENIGRSHPYRAQKTHCKYGHRFTPENTFIRRTRSGSTARVCRQCRRRADREWTARQKAAR